MAIELHWMIPEHVIFGRYADDISEQELSDAMNTIVEMIETTETANVHTLIDNTDVKSYPMSISVVRRSTQQLLRHPRYGWLITYGKVDPFTRFIVEGTTRIFGVRVRMFQHREDAIGYLLQVDETLQSTSLVNEVKNKKRNL